MDTEHKIEVTGVDMAAFVRAAYGLSRPQGLGYLHYKEGDIPQDSLDEILGRERKDSYIAISMDYVLGRAVKMTVFRDEESGKLFINDAWFDHSSGQLSDLLTKVGMPEKADQVREFS